MFKHASAEDFHRIGELNFLGNVYGAKAVLPRLGQIRGISLAYIVLMSCKNQLSVAEHGVR
jgi:hypothetical protein